METSRTGRTAGAILLGVLVALLIKHYARRDRSPETSDLPIACFNGDTERIRELLHLGHSVNMRVTENRVTPLHFAMVGEQSEAEELLRSHGADDSLKDSLGVTPARAREIMRDRRSRPLAPAVDSRWSRQSTACVYLVALGKHPDGFLFKGFRNAFVIGDGSIVVTAAHVVDDLVDAGSEGNFFSPLIASPFLGEIVEAKLLARDSESDIAVLRAPWKHPALRFGDGDVSAARTMVVVGYPRPDQVDPHGARQPSQPHLEELPLLRFDAEAGRKAIALGGSRWVGPGWSGSPILFVNNGELAGVFGNRRYFKVGDDFVFHDPLGASAHSVRRLLKEHDIDLPSPGEAADAPRDSETAFELVLDVLDAFTSEDVDPGREQELVERLVDLRPDSSVVHFLAAATFGPRIEDDEDYRAVTDRHWAKARSSDPSSVLIRASYARHLFVEKRYGDALAELDQLLEEDPDNRYCQLVRLRTLEETNPEAAAAYGASMAGVLRHNAYYWHTMSRIRLGLEQHDLAVEAARRALAIEKKRGALAWTLAKAGRLDEAEERYRSNLVEHDCQWCWFELAKFLVEHRPNSRQEARDAIQEAMRRAGQKLVDEEEMRALRKRLDLKSEDGMD